eukprot:276652-Chlamydomonas_euryale.AAC.1
MQRPASALLSVPGSNLISSAGEATAAKVTAQAGPACPGAREVAVDEYRHPAVEAAVAAPA